MNNGMFVLIVGAAVATYLTRFPLMLLSGKKKVPKKLAKLMSFIAPAVMTALIVPAIFLKQGKIDFAITNDYFISAIITAASAYFCRNMLLVIIIGLSSVGILSLF